MRYARICPNTNNWIKPSGGYKGPPRTFPGNNSYGYEEWIMGAPTITGGPLNGLRAGFIQGFGGRNSISPEDVTLFYMQNGVKFSALTISKCRKITNSEALDVYNYYVAIGFFSQMQSDLNAVGLAMLPFASEINIFNVVFKPSDIVVCSPQTVFLNWFPRYSILYK